MLSRKDGCAVMRKLARAAWCCCVMRELAGAVVVLCTRGWLQVSGEARVAVPRLPQLQGVLPLLGDKMADNGEHWSEQHSVCFDCDDGDG